MPMTIVKELEDFYPYRRKSENLFQISLSILTYTEKSCPKVPQMCAQD